MLFLLCLLLEDLDALRQKFESEKSKGYSDRVGTIGKIGALKTDEAAEFLISAFEAEKDASARYYMLTSLGTCGTPKAAQKLIGLVRDERAETNIRSQALSALGSLKTQEAKDTILEIAKNPKHALRVSAMSALARLPLKETEALWREALTDAQPTIRGMAFRELAPLKDKAVLDAAKKAIEDPKEVAYVKSAAIEPWKAVGGPEAVKLFLVAAASADTQIRRTLLPIFSALTDEASIAVLYGGLKHAEPAVRALVARSLGKLSHEKVTEQLEIAIKDKDVTVRIAAIESAAERKDVAILDRESQRGDDDAALAAIGALKQIPLLLKLAESKSPRIRATAIDALGDLLTPEALPVYEKAIQAKEWQVRASTARALSKLKMKESIDLLIERMAKEDGRMLVDFGEALRALTGKAIGYAAKPWKDWWKVARESFTFPDKIEGVGGGGGTTYFGVPVLSKRIIFCLDISGSMSAKIGAETRLEQAKKELSKALGALGKDVFVNLLFFDDKIEPWEKQMVLIKSNLSRAQERVVKLQPRGGTNIYDTLEKAFEDPNVDTIFLLSDGAPGSGKIVATDEILREIKRMNRTRQIVIHTISLGQSTFMKDLALQNGGQYVEVK